MRWYHAVGLGAAGYALARFVAAWMPYVQGASNAVGPYASGGTQTYQQANNSEYQYVEATLSFPFDVLGACVIYGYAGTKDGTTATQLDITTGLAYVQQASDVTGTVTQRWRYNAATTRSTVGNPSATMYLDLQPDGTFSWATTHSGQSGYLTLCTVTTDASSNISTVTDTRYTTVNLFPSAIGKVQFAGVNLLRINSVGGGAAGTTLWVGTTDPGSSAGEGDPRIKA